MLDNTRCGGQPGGQRCWIGDRALVVSDHAAVRAQGDIAQRNRCDSPYRGTKSEAEQLKRDGAVQSIFVASTVKQEPRNRTTAKRKCVEVAA